MGLDELLVLIKETFAMISLGFGFFSVFGLVGIRWTLSNSISSMSL